MSEWQPIETAPKDETYIAAIARIDGKWSAVSTIAWNVYLGAWADHIAPNEWADRHHMPRAKAVVVQPTHWMPLPEPPQ